MDVSGLVWIDVTVEGHNGQDGEDNSDPEYDIYADGGSGGTGGVVEGRVDTSSASSLSASRWTYQGGDGDRTYKANGGDGGDATTVTLDGVEIVIGEGGGGGGGAGAWFDDGSGGGGGARGGEGAGDVNGEDKAEDGDGSGDGGDGGQGAGGDSNGSPGNPGSPGGYWYDSGYINVSSTSTGGGYGWIARADRKLSPPTGLTADGGVEINLSWDTNTNATGYSVYRSSSPGVATSSENHIGDTTNTSFANTSFGSSTQYYYVVTATGGSNATESEGSDEVSAEPATPPLQPTNFSITAPDAASLDLSWDRNPDGGAPDEYYVYRAETTGSVLSDHQQVATVTTETYLDEGRVNGRTYYYRIVASNDDGDSDPSAESSGTTDLPAPSIDLITASSVREITLEWTKTDNNPDGEFLIVRGAETVGTVGVGTASFTDTDSLLDGEEYQYHIERDTGDALTESGTGTVTTVLPPVEGLAVDSVSGRSATLSWTDPSNNSDGYRLLLLKTPSDGSYTQDGGDLNPVGEGESTTHTTTELLDGQEYSATVETFTADTTAREDQ